MVELLSGQPTQRGRCSLEGKENAQMQVIEYQLLVQNWVRSQNPSDKEILAVMRFLEFLENIEDKSTQNG